MKSIPRDELFYTCLDAAEELIARGYPVGNVSNVNLAETLWKLETEKLEKNIETDQTIDYHDEIVSIEEVGELETVDISVSGDNLFFCNGILTKNSFGLPATADLMIALISTEELQEQGRIMCKQLKNRYNDVDHKRKFLLGIDKSVMRLFDEVDTGEEGINDDIPVFDATSNHEDAQKFVDFKI